MNNEEKNSEKTTDGGKKFMFSSKTLRNGLIISVVILVIVGICYLNQFHVEELNNFQPWVENFVGILLVFVGGVYVKTSYEKSRKGGTRYYQYKYRTSKLEKSMIEYCNQFTESQQTEAIGKIHQWVGSEEDREKYWKTVFYLQVEDKEFVKGWNDFNYYENMKLSKESNLDYFLLVRKYVYLKVYETYNEIIKGK